MPYPASLAPGDARGYGVGEDVVAAANLEQRKAVYGEVGDVYVTFGGGGGVAQEAGAGFKRGATVIPLRRSGGASNGMFNFPADALLRPCVCLGATRVDK